MRGQLSQWAPKMESPTLSQSLQHYCHMHESDLEKETTLLLCQHKKVMFWTDFGPILVYLVHPPSISIHVYPLCSSGCAAQWETHHKNSRRTLHVCPADLPISIRMHKDAQGRFISIGIQSWGATPSPRLVSLPAGTPVAGTSLCWVCCSWPSPSDCSLHDRPAPGAGTSAATPKDPTDPKGRAPPVPHRSCGGFEDATSRTMDAATKLTDWSCMCWAMKTWSYTLELLTKSRNHPIRPWCIMMRAVRAWLK